MSIGKTQTDMPSRKEGVREGVLEGVSTAVTWSLLEPESSLIIDIDYG